MSDGPALLAAILANRACDTARLVYADWLQEHGEPERAEFIRVQLAIAAREQRTGSRVISGPQRRRERDLHGILLGRGYCLEGWCATPHRHECDSLAIHGCAVGLLARGFVSEITCGADEWLEHGSAVLAAHPVTRVTLTTMPARRVNSPNISFFLLGGEWTHDGIALGFDSRTAVEAELERKWPGINFRIHAGEWFADLDELLRQLREMPAEHDDVVDARPG